MPDLLLELYCEEIPARMQEKAAQDLKSLLTNALVDAGLTYEAAQPYWTPRRLTLDLRGLSAGSPDRLEERKGPRVDAPEKAVEGFLKAAGLKDVSEAEIQNDPKKGDFYVAKTKKPGRPSKEIIQEVLPPILNNFPWPKSMRWGEGSEQAGSLKWVRPLQSILCSFGSEHDAFEVVDFEISGIKASNLTYGHRFHAPDAIKVKQFDDYVMALEKAKVVLDAKRRQDIIMSDAKNLAFAQGLELVEDAGLIKEVANLCEWPVSLIGTFDESFLELPDEVIQLTIKVNQKCFVLKDQKTQKLTNKFLLVAAIEADDGGVAIVKGNQKVVNARLSDAQFFWHSDLDLIANNDGFNAWVEKLDHVTFHAKLGSQGERINRIKNLAAKLAPHIGADEGELLRACHLAKADLSSAMVYEFAELQGFMGKIYAQRAHEKEAVFEAIEAHYRPQGPSDDVPNQSVSMGVALADKLDLLTQFWAIDEKPTGSKDPFALRRAALGVIRIILENNLRINLSDFGVDNDLLKFFHERLKNHLKDKGLRHDLIDAVVNKTSDDLSDIYQKLEAINALIASKDGTNLLAGYKRANNILAAEEKKGEVFDGEIKGPALQADEEKALYDAIQAVGTAVDDALHNNQFENAVMALGKLRAPIDAFFDNLMVNDDDAEIRSNRLLLLANMRALTHRVANFSKINT